MTYEECAAWAIVLENQLQQNGWRTRYSSRTGTPYTADMNQVGAVEEICSASTKMLAFLCKEGIQWLDYSDYSKELLFDKIDNIVHMRNRVEIREKRHTSIRSSPRRVTITQELGEHTSAPRYIGSCANKYVEEREEGGIFKALRILAAFAKQSVHPHTPPPRQCVDAMYMKLTGSAVEEDIRKLREDARYVERQEAINAAAERVWEESDDSDSGGLLQVFRRDDSTQERGKADVKQISDTLEGIRMHHTYLYENFTNDMQMVMSNSYSHRTGSELNMRIAEYIAENGFPETVDYSGIKRRIEAESGREL